MKLPILLFCALISFNGLNVKEQRKIISDADYNYVFYVSLDGVSNYEYDKEYYWYKSGEIHTSIGGSNGDILHGSYTKTHKNNNLTTQGTFSQGLKDDLWRYWHPNGELQEITEWKKGDKMGQYVLYSEKGEVLIAGNYKKNKKEGRWIDFKTRDTLYYKNGLRIEKAVKLRTKKDGTVIEKKPFKKRMKHFFAKMFSKKNRDSLSTKERKKKSPKKKKANKAEKQ